VHRFDQDVDDSQNRFILVKVDYLRRVHRSRYIPWSYPDFQQHVLSAVISVENHIAKFDGDDFRNCAFRSFRLTFS